MRYPPGEGHEEATPETIYNGKSYRVMIKRKELSKVINCVGTKTSQEGPGG